MLIRNAPQKSTFAVSVIIPMYNAEKYLSVCLESILIQTFTDFELLVVDDGSTDSSATIAESYLEKFGGRMKIITLPENTGSGAVPRNVGLDLSRGKYVYFMDADDLILDNALETLYGFAEKFQTDVLYMDCGFICRGEPVPTTLISAEWQPGVSTDIPRLETNNFAERMKNFLDVKYVWPPWTKFLRRDFLIDNVIKFPRMKISEDVSWTFEIVCLAKNFLCISAPLYVQRLNENSITRSNRSPEEEIIFWMKPFLFGMDCLDEFMSRFEFFNREFGVRLQILNLFAGIHFENMRKAIEALAPAKAYKIIFREFLTAGNAHPALIAFLLFIASIYRNELKKRTE